MTPGPALDRLVNEIMYGESPGAVYPFSTSPFFFCTMLKWAQERYVIHMEWIPRTSEWYIELDKPGDLASIKKYIGRHEQPFVALCLAIVSTKET